MGWASASEIFDPVAQALIDLKASAEMKRRVLGTLIDKLQDGDWDTEDESLREFSGDPVIVACFYEHGVGNRIDGDQVDGVLDVKGKRDPWWTLTCSKCGRVDAASLDVAGHDHLVRRWASHEQEKHGGNGVVDPYMLIGAGEAVS